MLAGLWSSGSSAASGTAKIRQLIADFLLLRGIIGDNRAGPLSEEAIQKIQALAMIGDQHRLKDYLSGLLARSQA